MNEIRILKKDDVSQLKKLAENFHQKEFPDPIERELVSWHARWRDEALEHYLSLGWSFGSWVKGEDEPSGFLLAQPLLFFEGMTQTLWVEFLAGKSAAIERELAAVAYRWARDKHFQKILFAEGQRLNKVLTELNGKSSAIDVIEMKTAKF